MAPHSEVGLLAAVPTAQEWPDRLQEILWQADGVPALCLTEPDGPGDALGRYGGGGKLAR